MSIVYFKRLFSLNPREVGNCFEDDGLWVILTKPTIFKLLILGPYA